MSFAYLIDSSLSTLISPDLVRAGLFYHIFTFLSLEGAWLFIWMICIGAISLWEIYHHHDRYKFVNKLFALGISVFIPVLIVTILIHFIIKPAIARQRPYIVYQVAAPCPKDYSFPSGHAAAAAAAATSSMWYDHNRKRDKLYLILAIGISYSRIALMCHYVGDVLIGGIIGYLAAHIFIVCCGSMIRSLAFSRHRKT
jgi:undecaprenyl-diphosphatase